MFVEEEAKSKAQQILQYFPGSTNVRKATYATITGGITAFLVSSGIYIPNDETLIVAAFIIVVRVLYVKLSPLITNLIDSGINVSTMLTCNSSCVGIAHQNECLPCQ